ncbi:MAG: ABC transporter ATP-binding protein, partial [Candidatus Thermoplasmatota archaeon]
LNCLSGLDDVTEGGVFVEGVRLSEMGDDRRTEYRAKRMGFVFQSYNLLPVLTARENAELPLLIGGVPYRQAREVARRMLALVGLEEFGDHKPAELSAGQQQRVAIARALVNKPAIVWADEPTGNLDSETSVQVMDLLVQLNRENGQTFVVVTHDSAIASRAHRILRMRNGQIVEQVRAG